MKKIIIICLAFSLTACATAVPNPFKPRNLYEIESAVGIARAAVVGYFSLRQCRKGEVVTPTNICSKYAVKVQLQRADENLEVALIQARDIVKNHPDLDVSLAIASVQSALTVFKQIAKQNNVRVE